MPYFLKCLLELRFLDDVNMLSSYSVLQLEQVNVVDFVLLLLTFQPQTVQINFFIYN